MNEETAIEETAAVDFSKFISKLEEDGSLTDSLEFYMACDDFDTVYSKVDLKATASEYKLMTNLKNFDAKPSQHNFNGDLEKLESFNIGDRAYMNLWIEDDFAQNLDNYTNRTKLVWEEKTDPVASISRDGVVTANGDGTTTLNGYIVPIDTDAILYEDGTSMSIDKNTIYRAFGSSRIQQFFRNISPNLVKILLCFRRVNDFIHAFFAPKCFLISSEVIQPSCSPDFLPSSNSHIRRSAAFVRSYSSCSLISTIA